MSAIDLFLHLIGIDETCATHQSFVAYASLTYSVDNLLGEVSIKISAYTLQFLLALLGEGVTQIGHYHVAAIMHHVAEYEVYGVAKDVMAYYARQQSEAAAYNPQRL